MEIKLYLRILRKRWWLIALAFLFTLIPTVLLVNRQPWVYEANTSYVIRPRDDFDVPEDEIVDAVGTLSRQPEISTTFAEIADSRLIKQRAIDRLELSDNERRGLSVNGRVIAGTNVVEITVAGPDPGIVRDVANAAGEETAAYVNALYKVFELQTLDSARFPNNPAGPNKLLTIALGAGFGLLLGVGLVFLIEYLQQPIPDTRDFNIIERETGAYSEPYLRFRLEQELSRAQHGGEPFSLALLKVDDANKRPATKPLSQLAAVIQSHVRTEDILAYLGEGRFALLLPRMEGEGARSRVKEVQLEISGTDVEVPVSSIGITSHQYGETTPDDILALADAALAKASENPDERIVLSAGSNGSPVAGLHDDAAETHTHSKESTESTGR